MFSPEEFLSRQFVQRIIRREVWILTHRAGFTSQDAPDLTQELIVRLLASLPHLDPAKAHPNVFITTIVERAVAMILRERRAQKRQSGPLGSLDSTTTDDGSSAQPTDFRGLDPELIDLALDVAEVMAQLPDDLRSLAEQLQSQSLAVTARDLGVPRSTLQRQVQRLRQYFEDAGLKKYL